MSTEPAWVTALWHEFDNMSDLDKIAVAGAWITKMTNELLPSLGERRRIAVATQLLHDNWDATSIAETIGARRSVITRLGFEGRQLLRERGRDIPEE